MSKSSAVEDVPAMESTNEPQPEQREPALTTDEESTQPEPTAVVPTPREPDVVEGEVIVIEPPETSAVPTPPKQKPYWLLIPFTILCCLVFVAGSNLLPLFTLTATVTILPVEKNVSLITTMQVHGRQLPTLTLSQSQTVPATGKQHQDATRAKGEITFYNGLLTAQTLAAGILFTGSDGVHIVTDQPASIPAANPPMEGQVTVSAHAVRVGASGNIPAYDINQACCATSVLAKNTAAFTGGAEARDVLVVTRTDITTAVTSLLVLLRRVEAAALQAQLTHGEDVLSPSCPPQVSSDRKMGEEAKQVSVTVSVTCSGMAYDAHAVDANATQMLAAAAQRFGTGYSLLGDRQISVLHATMTNQVQGSATLAVKLDATYVYQFSPGEKQHLVHLIAGKPKQQAIQALRQVPGIAGAAITITGNAATLPDNPGSITIAVAQRG
jgi:hypothetical protein